MMQEVPCSAFRNNGDGSWTSIAIVTISSPGGGHIQIGPGMTFSRGVRFMGIDLAALLDANCA